MILLIFWTFGGLGVLAFHHFPWVALLHRCKYKVQYRVATLMRLSGLGTTIKVPKSMKNSEFHREMEMA